MNAYPLCASTVSYTRMMIHSPNVHRCTPSRIAGCASWKRANRSGSRYDAGIVDEKSALYLVGSRLDFVDTLQESGFKIENPNASNTCGCGQSFAA